MSLKPQTNNYNSNLIYTYLFKCTYALITFSLHCGWSRFAIITFKYPKILNHKPSESNLIQNEHKTLGSSIRRKSCSNAIPDTYTIFIELLYYCNYSSNYRMKTDIENIIRVNINQHMEQNLWDYCNTTAVNLKFVQCSLMYTHVHTCMHTWYML